MEALLEFDRVDIRYHGNAVVKDLCFALQPGEILGVVGESGSGKSTVVRAAMGLLDSGGAVTRGDIRLRGTSLPGLSPREMRSVRGREMGLIFQDCGASLCPVATIGGQIHESMAAHMTITKAQARERALEVFRLLCLQEGPRIWDSYPFELSGGMCQRVCIALAMLLQPAVLLADEPTSALDVSVQKQVVLELLRLREVCGTAIVVVTHDIGVVSAMADTVLVLKDGRAVECGARDRVLQAPQNEYTKLLLAAVPRLRRD